MGGWGEETGLSTLRRDRRVTGQGLKVPRSHRRNIFFRYQAGEQTGRKNRASHTKQLVQKQFAWKNHLQTEKRKDAAGHAGFCDWGGLLRFTVGAPTENRACLEDSLSLERSLLQAVLVSDR